MPIDLRIKMQDLGVKRRLQRVNRQLGNLRSMLGVIGEIGLTSIQQNFEKGGRPEKWQPLKLSTILQRQRERKWPGQILVRRGTGGGLLGSIYYQIGTKHVALIAKKKYAAIHHFGGQAGRGRKVTILARPYMIVQKDDQEEMREAIRRHVLR